MQACGAAASMRAYACATEDARACDTVYSARAEISARHARERHATRQGRVRAGRRAGEASDRAHESGGGEGLGGGDHQPRGRHDGGGTAGTMHIRCEAEGEEEADEEEEEGEGGPLTDPEGRKSDPSTNNRDARRGNC